MSPPLVPELRVATWNIHDARGRDGKRDLDRVAEMLGQLRAPLVGLQEVRCGSEACDAATLARQHGYHWHAIETWRHDDAQYGNALLTTLPAERTQVHDLSVGCREPRGALEVHLPWQGQHWRVVVTPQADDVLPVGQKTGVLRESLDIKGRLQRNPYGMIAGACGIGFVLGGGLFTRLMEKLLGTGLRVALMVALPSLEKRITKVLAGSKLNEDKENDQ